MKKTATVRSLLLLTLTLLAVLALFSAPAWAEPVITAQPTDAEVNYPDGATFHVEVADKASVASWQWFASDGYSSYTLNGVSAKTDTLVIPATDQNPNDLWFCCKITNKDGSFVFTDDACLHIANVDENKPVLYAGDYALEPGEKLDLADTTLGSGTIEYAADGVNVTLTDVRLSTAVMTYDVYLAPSNGLFLYYRDSPVQTYYLHFKGVCQFDDTFFDPNYNAAGVVINSFFACDDEDEVPTIVMDGDGNLLLRGGSNQIYSDGNIELAAGLATEVNGSYFNDGIRCRDLIIDDGVRVSLRVNGTGVHTEGDLILKDDSYLSVASSAPHVSVGPTTKNLLFIVGDLKASNAELKLNGWADPAEFLPYDSMVATMSAIDLAGEGSVIAEGTDIDIELTSLHAEETFAMNFYGVTGEGANNGLILARGSSLNVKIDAPEVVNAGGLGIPGFFDVEDGSHVNVDVKAQGEIIGVAADRKLAVSDSSLKIKAESVDGGLVLGAVCGEASFSLNKAGNVVSVAAPGGVAFAAGTETTDDPVSYTEGYLSKLIGLAGKTMCLKPESYEINLCGVPAYSSTVIAETFYGADKSKPATEVLLSATLLNPFEDVAEEDWFFEPVLWAVGSGVTTGTDATHFTPYALCSRAQLVTLLWRAAGSPAPKADCTMFFDIDPEAYYMDALSWAYYEDIVQGLEPHTFGPDASLTREQLAAFIYRYAQTKGEYYDPDFKLDFTDAASVSPWAGEPMSWCVMKGIINGVGNGRLAPQGTADRAQVVTMLYRFFEK